MSYSRSDLVAGLKQTGLCIGDTVFFHVSHLLLGEITEATPESERCDWLCAAIQEVIGPMGTMLLPSYTFSFIRNEVFDIENAPATPGAWSGSGEFLEYFRRLSGVIRSADPNYSVTGLGPQAKELLTRLPATSYGRDCFHERLMQMGGKICCIGVSLSEVSFIHFVEEAMNVPFRYKKLFTGFIRQACKLSKQGWISTIPIRAENGRLDGSRLEGFVRTEGRGRNVTVGKGEISSVECKDLYKILCRELTVDPWATATGPAGDPIEIELARTGHRDFDLQLPENASMEELIAALWRLPRDIVSDGYDAALGALAKQVPMTIHEFPSGSECWSWIIPEKWTCYEACLETVDGRRLFSYADHALHVVSYSLPFEGVVSRDELCKHLHVHPVLSDAIPFVYKYYDRDWGLCCSRQMRDSLLDESYRVIIRTDFSYGTLKVGEVLCPGESTETVVLCAHLCHPGMVNDDLSGVVVGLKVIQELLRSKSRRYTYRFIILPETIGSVAYLSRHAHLVAEMIGGLFLEMLGLNNPHALQLSFAANTTIDHCFSQILNDSDPLAWIGPFRTVVGNDERQFNAPGVRVPMLSLSRVNRRKSSSESFYPEYHSSHDDPSLASPQRLEESVRLVLAMIDAFEASPVPVNLYPGEVFCSRFGINIDPIANPEGFRLLFDIMFLIDGTRSIDQIAQTCGISVQATRSTIDLLCEHGLAAYL